MLGEIDEQFKNEWAACFRTSDEIPDTFTKSGKSAVVIDLCAGPSPVLSLVDDYSDCLIVSNDSITDPRRHAEKYIKHSGTLLPPDERNFIITQSDGYKLVRSFFKGCNQSIPLRSVYCFFPFPDIRGADFLVNSWNLISQHQELCCKFEVVTEYDRDGVETVFIKELLQKLARFCPSLTYSTITIGEYLRTTNTTLTARNVSKYSNVGDTRQVAIITNGL